MQRVAFFLAGVAVGFVVKNTAVITRTSETIISGRTSSSVRINDTTYSGNYVRVINDEVYIDDVKQDSRLKQNSTALNVYVTGNPDLIKTVGPVTVTGNAGNIGTTGRVEVGGNCGNINTTGSVTVKGSSGRINTTGKVTVYNSK
jgi:hypothetical protein